MPNALLGDHVVGFLPILADEISEQMRSHIEVFPEGEYVHHQAGKMKVTQDDLAAFAADINQRGDKIPLDFDHSFGKGLGSLSAGWFIRGSASIEPSSADASLMSLWADVQWTPRAAQSLRDGEYKFISPEFNFRWKDNTGKMRNEPRMFAAALTNRPFFEQMGPVNLCDEGIASMLAEEHDGREAKKEETTMPKAIAEALGLKADATDAEIEAAFKKKMKDDEDAMAALEAAKIEAEGKLPSDELLAKLTADASAGAEAKKELEQVKMDTLLDGAIRDRKLDPAEREQYATLYAANPESVEKLIESRKAGSFDPIGSEGGSQRKEAIAMEGSHESLYGFNPPSETTVSHSPMAVDEDSAKIHVAALELLKAEGKVLTYTADEYIAAATMAASEQGISL